MIPLVSVLIPAYNAAEVIEETLRSALAQTWPRREIIVVDDGSRDNTLTVARRFESREVLVVTQENQGVSAARNAAFARSQGDYIQWLDADDLLSPDKIALQMEVRARGCTEQTLLSCGWGHFMYRHSRAEFVPTPLWGDLAPAEWLRRKMGGNLHMQTATWLTSRALTQAAGPWDTELLRDNDGEYFCRVLLASDGVRFVPGARVYYRLSDFNRVSYIGRSQRKMDALFRSMRLHINYLRSLDDGAETRAACIRYLQTWLEQFYPERPEIVREIEGLAAELGGWLEPPRLSWKWDWIRRLFGWSAAKQARMSMRELKWTAVRAWDRSLARLEGRTRAIDRGTH